MQLVRWYYWLGLIIALGALCGVQTYRIALLEKDAVQSQLDAAQEGSKAAKDREGIEHENRKLPITDIDRKLRASGWMRD